MKKNIFILTALTLLIMVSSCNKKTETEDKQDNPLLQEWTSEYGVPPFDKIKTEHYIPAFEEAMKVNKEEIDAIVNNPDAPTFENTIEALEESGSLLTRVESIFFNNYAEGQEFTLDNCWIKETTKVRAAKTE